MELIDLLQIEGLSPLTRWMIELTQLGLGGSVPLPFPIDDLVLDDMDMAICYICDVLLSRAPLRSLKKRRLSEIS